MSQGLFQLLSSLWSKDVSRNRLIVDYTWLHFLYVRSFIWSWSVFFNAFILKKVWYFWESCGFYVFRFLKDTAWEALFVTFHALRSFSMQDPSLIIGQFIKCFLDLLLHMCGTFQNHLVDELHILGSYLLSVINSHQFLFLHQNVFSHELKTRKVCNIVVRIWAKGLVKIQAALVV